MHSRAAFLDRQGERKEALVTKMPQPINRVSDLRTALVSAAVTGKIDGRGEVE